jgi:MoaA/NifB/PqqE/SkfB family radical SAM enzyme
MNGAISTLPVLVLNVHARCNCRCVMCDIWKTAEHRETPLAFVERQLDDFTALGVEWVVFSGGEPLMHSDLFGLAAAMKGRGIRVTVLTSGLLIRRYAAQIAAHIDDLIVSLDGPPQVHDEIRGAPGAFDLIQNGVSELRRCRPGYRIAARCTVQKLNHDRLNETLASARALGLTSISFLASDLTSMAFNRQPVWDSARQSSVALNHGQVAVLEREIEKLIASDDPLVTDSPEHLRRIVGHFRAHLGLQEYRAPRCNAPWVSAVVEVDGTVRPCFFHRAVGQVRDGLAEIINGPDAISFRRTLNVETNETCRQCVCSLHRGE